MNITEQLKSIYILNPGYVLRNDITRSVLATADNNSFIGLDVNDISTIIHPMYAMFLSFFNGDKYLDETLSDIVEYFDISRDDAIRIASKMIDNPTSLGVEYDGCFFYLPDRVIIEKKEGVKPIRYSADDFAIDCKVDLINKRLNKPIFASILISNHCVTNCIYCYADKRIIQDCAIPFERIKGLIEEAKKIGIVSFDIHGGELFLYKDWEKLLTTMYSAGYSVYISSKYPLNDEEVKRLKATGTKEIQISLDSIFEDDLITNLRVGKGYHKKILNTIELLNSADFKIKIKAVITNPIYNIERIEKFIRYLDKYENIIIVELTAPGHSLYKTQEEFFHFRLTEKQILEIKDLASRIGEENHFRLNTDIPEKEGRDEIPFETKKRNFYERASCSGNLTSFMILPNGDVTMCEEAYFNKNLSFGNILNNSIMDVWSSERAKNLFYIPQSIFPKESPCSNCTEFEDCRYNKGVCWTDIMAAYGEDKWLFPSPDCHYAPLQKNDTLIW